MRLWKRLKLSLIHICNLVQKECVGTESKSETEKLLRQAMDDYEKKKFVDKAENLTY